MVESGSDLMNMRLKVLEFVLWSEHIAYEKGGMIYQLNSRCGVSAAGDANGGTSGHENMVPGKSEGSLPERSE